MKRTRCEECNGKIIKKKIDFRLYGISLGLFPAEVCTQCGEEIFDEETSDKIDAVAKAKGLWGLGAETKISKSGTSLAITVNKKIVDFMNLKKGEAVYIHPETKNRLVIEIQ
ncbi:hypothetical protein CMO92_02020 [Candidatus Woesearchaeota archaeon]|nr:hypothetical protein [Candidatus Woesearchaeota archaeon]